jgi:hypothetical protein
LHTGCGSLLDSALRTGGGSFLNGALHAGRGALASLVNVDAGHFDSKVDLVGGCGERVLRSLKL